MIDVPTLPVEVSRTFSPFKEADSGEPDIEFWFRHNDGYGVSWNDLIGKRLVVVVGEAGIGKTYEFHAQVRRLRSANKAAFFIPLNLLVHPDDWVIALGEDASLFEHWKSSTDEGYFFLDAVDEARLTGPTALRRALACMKRVLVGQTERASLFVSSRVSDWNLSQVRHLIEQELVLTVPVPLSNRTDDSTDVVPQDAASGKAVAVPLVAYYLDGLSVDAAKQLAGHYGVQAISEFWEAVEDGAYEFLASRPLDLEWMASRWNSAGELGTFMELLEDAVTNRLREKNPGYVDAGVALSPDQLRSGVEALAAASVLSGNAYFQVEIGVAPPGVITLGDPLPDWKPDEYQRLLGSAIFDEGTYGRVQFHHRALREYLAAWWVKRRLDVGLPFGDAWALFVGTPYSEEILLPSRRPVLCWLSALDARVRTRVIRAFPEMVIFEGDPQQWSVDDVVGAFAGYLDRVKSGFRADWNNDPSEFRRVAKTIPPAQLSTWIEAYRGDLEVLVKLLTVIKHGRVTVCADQVFAMYRDRQNVAQLLGPSLDTLSTIATSDHRAEITEDLLAGRLAGNERIAAGIRAVGLAHFTSDHLLNTLAQTRSENRYGGGAMASMVTSDLLPKATLQEATLLLAAVLTRLPELDAHALACRSETEDNRDGWMLSVLPDVLLKCLNLSPSCDTDSIALMKCAALATEKLRHTPYANEQDFQDLRAAVARFPELRQEVALGIALSEMPRGISILITGTSGLVRLDQADLDWLVKAANEASADHTERNIWYRIAADIALMFLRGRARNKVLNELASGPDTELRRNENHRARLERVQVVRTRRGWTHQNLAQERVTSAREVSESESNKAALLKKISGIQDGSDYNLIVWLVRHAVASDQTNRYTKVSVNAIHREFGPEIGTAFDEGLAQAWRHIDVPDSTAYLDNSVPWLGIVGLASANHAFRTGLRTTELTKEELARVVRFCVWEPRSLEPWFTELAQNRLDQVCSALAPWFDFELALSTEAPVRRVINMVLAGPVSLQEAILPRVVKAIREGAIPNEERRRTLVLAIADALPTGRDFMGEVAANALEVGFTASPQRFEAGWFRDWASIDFAGAWNGLMEHRDKGRFAKDELVEQVSAVLDGNSQFWNQQAGDERKASALAALFGLADEYLRDLEKRTTAQPDADRLSPRRKVLELWNRIPDMLSTCGGPRAYEALMSLAKGCGEPMHAARIRSQAYQQAAREAEDATRISAAALPSIGEPYIREARTEGELFLQVMARLVEIADGIEKGPFSERGLFPAGVVEKQLQLWLAARLEDTPRRSFTARFVVTREPTVDADKRTDIEVSSKVGKVCIEIKPLDKNRRSYSAQSLAEDTLGRQLLEQYLRGRNSQHGILVIFRLDSKRWQIPRRKGNRPFGELVDYLREQARNVLANDSQILGLEVLPIDCTAPS
ncbi:hypothetical protein [Accumulibacter sp.]|uniref:hypothetical protein n=1 Tax=Accumulibacter sp. TaxID=2053492 RepID=UPI00262C3A59|nr:hypothetical protein [Accumulibacter sp.]